ncbi:cytochrome P450 [Nocardia alni]|uniref:cytochrome P450 n=1 Tax=Nocardia alni TaxID=2815723 RepID=UPI0020B255BD|nr:cytochrome P450 [Nocardia alni]
MTTPQSPVPESHITANGTCPVQHGASLEVDPDRFPMYTPDFVTDPGRTYDQMRRAHPTLVPVELAPGVPAYLCIGYQTAVRILNDPDHFPSDPRTWEKDIPADSPVRPMMEWYPAARYNTGATHLRYRAPSVVAIDNIHQAAIRAMVEKAAVPLIASFCENGSAELVMQYAFPLILDVLNQMCGCPGDIGERVALGMADRFDSDRVKAKQGMVMVRQALMELIALKREQPGDDVTSHLAHHPNGLDDIEVFAQLMSFYGAGFEAQRTFLANALLLIFTDPRFQPDSGRNLSTTDALEEVLFNNPPMANFCTTYPRQPIQIDGVWLPADQPVLISLAACNNDPHIRGAGTTSIGNRSHLAWSAGPHACPAKDVAYQTVQSAIDQLFDRVGEMQLAIRPDQLKWRPGPFHRALVSMPVAFAPLSKEVMMMSI